MNDSNNISMRKLVDCAVESLDELIKHLESCKTAAPNDYAETIFKQCYWSACGIHTLLQVADDMSQDSDNIPTNSEYFGEDDEDDDDDGESIEKG